MTFLYSASVLPWSLMPTKDTGSGTSKSLCHCSALLQRNESWNLVSKKVTAIVWFVRWITLFTNDWMYDFLQVYDKTTALKGLESNVESWTWQRPTTPCFYINIKISVYNIQHNWCNANIPTFKIQKSALYNYNNTLTATIKKKHKW